MQTVAVSLFVGQNGQWIVKTKIKKTASNVITKRDVQSFTKWLILHAAVDANYQEMLPSLFALEERLEELEGLVEERGDYLEEMKEYLEDYESDDGYFERNYLHQFQVTRRTMPMNKPFHLHLFWLQFLSLSLFNV